MLNQKIESTKPNSGTTNYSESNFSETFSGMITIASDTKVVFKSLNKFNKFSIRSTQQC